VKVYWKLKNLVFHIVLIIAATECNPWQVHGCQLFPEVLGELNICKQCLPYSIKPHHLTLQKSLANVITIHS